MKILAFIDECGNTSLSTEKIGTSSHYIVACAILAAGDYERICAHVEAVRLKFFGPGEMKSSSVGNDFERRQRVLAELSVPGLTFHVFVADKRQIYKDSGLIYKRPFIKYLAAKATSRLFGTFKQLEVLADETGDETFRKEFQRYILRKFESDLFPEQTYRHADSRSSVCIQAADIVAGTLAKVYDDSIDAEIRKRLTALLKPAVVSLEEWPPVYAPLNRSVDEAFDESDDGEIRRYCRDVVLEYLQNLDDSQEDDQVRQIALTYLLDQSRYLEDDRFISAGELITHLKNSGLDISTQWLRTGVIAHFRDHRVIIGSDNKGYKIPTRVCDVIDYVERCDKVTKPLIGRLRQARDSVRLLTRNKLDILGDEKYAFLRRVVDLHETKDTFDDRGTV